MPDIKQRVKTIRLRLEREWRTWNMNRQVRSHTQSDLDMKPVVLFNVSSRLSGFSQNAAFTLLTGWGFQINGVPVIHFSCQAGMSRCVLGTNPDDPTQTPPCKACIAQSKKLTASAKTNWFRYRPDPGLTAALIGLNLEELSVFEFPLKERQVQTVGSRKKGIDKLPWEISSDSLMNDNEGLLVIPLGSLVLPSLRWALRRHHLCDDKKTRFLLREYIQSAYRVAMEFSGLLLDVEPQAAVVFNGLQFPEATARWIAQQNGVRVITHEVGFQPFSAFFSDGQVTAYPIEIPDGFELSPEQQAKIDSHLSRRFQGDFTMAGIRFWPDMKGLSEDFLQQTKTFDQIVPIFTNVIFDTSQVHANTVFPDMFAWLDLLLVVIRKHSETLFVIRAHPDEMRDGKKSRESVHDWVISNGVEQLPNVVFVASEGALSSYDLIRRSKFVMVYNSSIGLEAALLGIPVLCGGKARYTQYPTVFLPKTPDEYQDMAEQLLVEDDIDIPTEFQRNAGRVLYHQFYRSSLLFGEYLEAHPTPGYVQLKRFHWNNLLAEKSTTMRVIIDGVLNDKPFLMPEESGQQSAVMSL